MSTITTWSELEQGALRESLNARHPAGVQRWDERKVHGMTDDDLRTAIAREFGIAGGASFPMWHAYKGENNPRFWLNTVWAKGNPTLEGQSLVNAVRELLDIPTPLEVKNGRQMHLFEVA